MVLTLLRDDSLTRKVLEVILDSPSGRRSLSRLARTCRALCEPALDILWRELDSFTPIVGLFPSLMRKARKPSMGLVKAPGKDDWNTFNRYNERVRRITYDERTSAVIASMLSENQPHEHIFPLLNDLTWRVQTPAGLNHWEMFISPEVHNFHLEVAAQLPQLGSFLKNMSKHTRLSTFSLNSPTALPEAFTDHLRDQEWLERVVLIAPGALSPNIGQWLASLEHLTQLQLDLSARGMLAVEGFFDQLISRSGCSTPSSETADEDEPSFSKLRRSSLRLTGDLPSKRIFRELRKLQLTGEVSNIAVFLSNITSPLTHMDFVIEDPPDKVDWQDLCTLICERFGNSLLSLRVTATGSARFADLVRSTPRGEPASNRLSLQFLTSLPNLVRLEIDLPESVIFTSEDFACLAQATPRLELLKLCPLARFPANTSSPQVTLDDLSLLLRSCRNIHTISAVFDAKPIGNEILTMRQASSDSLLRLHVGHSWISDPLRVAISLSHIAPRLETLKWFQEKTRQGYVETNAKNWQSLWDFLPVFQNIRLVERSFAKVSPAIPRRKKVDKCVGITTLHVDRGIDAKPFTANSSVQAAPLLVDRLIEAKPTNFNVSVDATPALTCASVDATTTVRMNHQSVGTETLPEEPASVPAPRTEQTISRKPQTLVQSYFYHIFSLFYRIFVIYPFTIPSQIIYVATGSFRRWSQGSRILPRLPQVEGRQRTAQNGVAHDTTKTMNNGDIIPLSNQAVQDTQKWNNDTYDMNEVVVQDKNKVIETAWLIECQTRTNRRPTRHLGRSFESSRYIMADNKKQEKDFTKEVDELLQNVDAVAKSGKLQDALDKLFALEKQTRNAADPSSTTRLVKAIVQYTYDARDYSLVNSSITLLSKKHGQLKVVIQAMVELAMSWLEEVKQSAGVEKWLELVETLRSVTEGKIFLETPRARVTLSLALYHEGLSKTAVTPAAAKDSLQTASDLLSDLQVETYSSMERREKTEFILEQMRLLIALAKTKDAESGKDGKDLGGGEAEWVKARVGGRKVNEEFLKQTENEDLKLKYYDLMVQHALHYSSYLDVAKYYYKVWETPSIKSDVSNKGRAALEHIVYYIILAPHNNEQSDMLHHLFIDPALARLELHYNLTKCFVTRELMRWPGIESIYGEFLRQTPVFSQEKRWEDLHTRIIEHNVRVVAEYYSRITLARLTTLLDLTPKQTEETLCRLVVSGTVWARVDRPAGVVSFRGKRSAEDVMNDWSSDMQKLLGLVEKTWMGMNAALAAQSRVKSAA